MTGVFRRSVADDDATGEVGDRVVPADRWLDAMERWGAALERGDLAEVDRLVHQSRVDRSEVHLVERVGDAPVPFAPVPVYPMPVDPVHVDPVHVDPVPFDPMPFDPMPFDPMEFGGAAG